MRIENNGIRYFGFNEIAGTFGLQPIVKVTKDKAKLESQKEKFSKKHKCRACGQPLSLVPGSNIMVCTNPACKGIKNERETKDGDKIVTYSPSYDILDELGATIAGNIFDKES